MGKSLTQITFDFAVNDEKEAASALSSESDVLQNSETELAPNELKKDASDKKVIKHIEEKDLVVESVVPKRKSPRGRLSLKEIHLNVDLIQIPPDEILFQKQYYSIGLVAEWFKVNQSLIRYWETEFDILEPRKNRKGDRFFRPIDVKNLVLIFDLLRRRKFTIEGAKDFLKKNKKADEKFLMIQSLEKIKAFMNELKANLG